MQSALERRLEVFSARFPWALAGPADPEEIDAAEAEVCTRFPDSYRSFLLRWGGGYVGHQPVAGVRPSPSGHRAREDGSVIMLCEHFREQGWPGTADWICVSSDGEGNAIGLDPQGRVVTSDRARPLDVTVLAPDLETWLHALLDENEALERAVEEAQRPQDPPRAEPHPRVSVALALVALAVVAVIAILAA